MAPKITRNISQKAVERLTKLPESLSLLLDVLAGATIVEGKDGCNILVDKDKWNAWVNARKAGL